eukprot:gene4250-4958_t
MKYPTSITPGASAVFSLKKPSNAPYQPNRPQRSILDLNVDSLEDKPWNKPGADITDYFNYNFTEETWMVYRERQNQLRAEQANLGKIKSFESKSVDNKSDLPPELMEDQEDMMVEWICVAEHQRVGNAAWTRYRLI